MRNIVRDFSGKYYPCKTHRHHLSQDIKPSNSRNSFSVVTFCPLFCFIASSHFFLCVRQIGICQCSKGKISRQNCWVAFHLLILHIEASNKIRLLIWHFQQRKAIQKKISTATQRARNANEETDNKRKQWNRRLFCFSTLTSVDGCSYSLLCHVCSPHFGRFEMMPLLNCIQIIPAEHSLQESALALWTVSMNNKLGSFSASKESTNKKENYGHRDRETSIAFVVLIILD